MCIRDRLEIAPAISTPLCPQPQAEAHLSVGVVTFNAPLWQHMASMWLQQAPLSSISPIRNVAAELDAEIAAEPAQVVLLRWTPFHTAGYEGALCAQSSSRLYSCSTCLEQQACYWCPSSSTCMARSAFASGAATCAVPVIITNYDGAQCPLSDHDTGSTCVGLDSHQWCSGDAGCTDERAEWSSTSRFDSAPAQRALGLGMSRCVAWHETCSFSGLDCAATWGAPNMTCTNEGACVCPTYLPLDRLQRCSSSRTWRTCLAATRAPTKRASCCSAASTCTAG